MEEIGDYNFAHIRQKIVYLYNFSPIQSALFVTCTSAAILYSQLSMNPCIFALYLIPAIQCL